MQSSLAVRLPASRIAQLKALAGSGKLKRPCDIGNASMVEVLEVLIQREWERTFRGSPSPDFRIKTGRDNGTACVSLGHDALGDLLLTSEHARALGRGARRVACGDQAECLVIEDAFTRKGILIHLRPHGRGYVLSFAKREPLGLTRTMVLDLSRWLVAAAAQAEARL